MPRNRYHINALSILAAIFYNCQFLIIYFKMCIINIEVQYNYESWYLVLKLKSSKRLSSPRIRPLLPYLLKLGHLFLREHGEDAGAATLSLAAATAARSSGAGILWCCRFLLDWCWLGLRCRSCLLLLLGLLLLFFIRLRYRKFYKIFSSTN